MTAKTILIQLHHKVKTFQYLNKHLILVAQNEFINYVKNNFSFESVRPSISTDSMHFHSYKLIWNANVAGFNLELTERISTDSEGLEKCLGLKVKANVELSSIIRMLQDKVCDSTKLEQ